MEYKVYLDSADINCETNSILSTRVFRYLTHNGHTVVRALPFADYIIVNTCGFDTVHENICTALYARFGRDKKPGTKIISIGCLNLIHAELQERWPDIVFATDLDSLDALFYKRVRFAEVDEAFRDDSVLPLLAERADRARDLPARVSYLAGELIAAASARLGPGGTRVQRLVDKMHGKNRCFVEIGSGCAGTCAYCGIKKARGQPRSRGVRQILDDIARVRRPGFTLCLVADDCGSYGVDIGETLFGLAQAINERFPDQDLELYYVNPHWLLRSADAYVGLVAEARVVGLNVPLQSGSDRVLERMNRSYRVDEVLGVLARLRAAAPDCILHSHLLVGFPGENASDFRRTLAVVPAFDYVYPYAYSDRPGTAAAAMDGKIPAAVLRSRMRRLRFAIYSALVRSVARDLSRRLRPGVPAASAGTHA